MPWQQKNAEKQNQKVGDDCSSLFESDHGISLGPCEFEKGV